MNGSPNLAQRDKLSENISMSDNSTMSTASLLSWYGALRDGQNSAVERLWRMYFERMVHVARRNLEGAKKTIRDEEDIALSAFKSFCLGFQQGKFVEDGKPENLWPLLVTLTINKSIDHLRSLSRAKRRGTDAARSDTTLVAATQRNADWETIASREPSPEMQVAMQDSFESLLTMLDDTDDTALRQIVLLAIEGRSPSQIAGLLGNCSVRTVQRKLKTIRSLWESRFGESD